MNKTCPSAVVFDGPEQNAIPSRDPGCSLKTDSVTYNNQQATELSAAGDTVKNLRTLDETELF